GSSGKFLAGMMLAGGTAGLIAGDWFVRDKSYTPGQAVLVDLAGVAGGLLALGATYLAAPDASEGAFLVATTLGAAAGGGTVAMLAAQSSGDIAQSAPAPSFAVVPTLPVPSGGRTPGDVSIRDFGLRVLGRF
ncbi:MAG TPA: hypothetical protein VGF45_02600, partial [Polyangia bacterium]